MTDQLTKDEALVAAAVLASLYYKTDDGGVLIHDNKRILSAARWALDMNTDIRTALAGEAKAGDDECAKGNHAWRGPLLGWWRCVLCGEKTGDAGHPSKTKLAALEAENARLKAALDDECRINSNRAGMIGRVEGQVREGHQREARLIKERDAAVTQRDEFQRRMLEAQKDKNDATSMICQAHRERDALAAKVKEMEERLAAIRAAAKE